MLFNSLISCSLGWAEPPKVEVKIGVKKPDIAPRPAAAPAPVNALPSDLSFLTNSLASLGLGGPRNSSSNTHILPGVHGNTEIVIPPLDGKPIQSAKGVIDTAQVHFSYVTNKVEPLKEEVFRTVFQHFGPVLDVAIKKSQYHPVSASFFLFCCDVTSTSLLFVGQRSSDGLWFHSLSIDRGRYRMCIRISPFIT